MRIKESDDIQAGGANYMGIVSKYSSLGAPSGVPKLKAHMDISATDHNVTKSEREEAAKIFGEIQRTAVFGSDLLEAVSYLVEQNYPRTYLECVAGARSFEVPLRVFEKAISAVGQDRDVDADETKMMVDLYSRLPASDRDRASRAMRDRGMVRTAEACENAFRPSLEGFRALINEVVRNGQIGAGETERVVSMFSRLSPSDQLDAAALMHEKGAHKTVKEAEDRTGPIGLESFKAIVNSSVVDGRLDASETGRILAGYRRLPGDERGRAASHLEGLGARSTVKAANDLHDFATYSAQVVVDGRIDATETEVMRAKFLGMDHAAKPLALDFLRSLGANRTADELGRSP